jgi:serine/threonine protein kinase
MGVCSSNSAALFAKLFEFDETVALSSGTSVTVFQGHHRRTGEPVIIKRIAKSGAADNPSRGKFWDDEVATMHQCTPHPNIIELLHVYESPTHVFIVTEFAEGGELFEALISVRRAIENSGSFLMVSLVPLRF